MLGWVLAVSLLAEAVPAASPAAAPAPTVAPAIVPGPQLEKPKPKPMDHICWSEKPVGSHVPTVMCGTRLELEARQQADQDALRDQSRFAGRYVTRAF